MSTIPQACCARFALALPSDWDGYNNRVKTCLGQIASNELAARAYTGGSTGPDPEGFEFRFCLPGPGGYAGYRDLVTGEPRFFRQTQTGFVELGGLQKAA